ncbi:unconventional myosin-XVIIIb isoform X2 [Microcaecilia unicolor]|uniref:Unconventional myosin-XVIIIb isoform X2 n=1 Tax=Microcaecilia unicolor TaxID=1415580 RepID=A0A6P7ZER0_9AMPH|nr:unconventional myosin-XVIIIb isoform X2 [Microcaecilia unicolor]
MAISSRLALWEQKIREEDKSPTPTSPPPIFSVVSGGFIKQLVRETEKESKEAKIQDKQKKEDPTVKQDPAPDVLKSPGKLNDNLVKNFLLKDENFLGLEEMDSKPQLLMNGLNGEKHQEQESQEINKKPLILKTVRRTASKHVKPVPKPTVNIQNQEETKDTSGTCKCPPLLPPPPPYSPPPLPPQQIVKDKPKVDNRTSVNTWTTEVQNADQKSKESNNLHSRSKETIQGACELERTTPENIEKRDLVKDNMEKNQVKEKHLEDLVKDGMEEHRVKEKNLGKRKKDLVKDDMEEHQIKDKILGERKEDLVKDSMEEHRVKEKNLGERKEDLVKDSMEEHRVKEKNLGERKEDLVKDRMEEHRVKEKNLGEKKEDLVNDSMEEHRVKEKSLGEREERAESDKVPEDVWYETEQVWFVHKYGFTLATELKPDVGTPELPEGRVRIRCEADNTVMDVDEENIHRTNPSKLDYAEDLAMLISLNESSVINTLQHRYQSQLSHTYAGPNLVAIRPSAMNMNYPEKVFKGKKDSMPPHICSLAQRAYWNMLMQHQDQTIIPMGRSGAGKTTLCQAALEYLVSMAGSVNGTVTVEKIKAVFSILKAFGTVSTSHSHNCTRFSMVMSLDFNTTGHVTAAHLQTMLLENIRVAQQPEEESNFNVFSYLLAGLDLDLRTELYMHQMADSNSFGIMPCLKPEEKQRASVAFDQLQAAMETLGFTENEQKAIWHVLAGIYHLGAAGTCKVGRKQFMKFDWANNAASVLGSDYEELSTAVFKHHLRKIIEQATSRGKRLNQDEEKNSGPKMTAVECIEGMASGLYEELFAAIVSLINRSFSSSHLSSASIMVMDTPGFQNPRHQKKDRAATFEELCHNYVQERLRALFYKRTFVSEMERYREENIEVAFDLPELSPVTTVSIIDQTSSQLNVRNGQAEESKGLLWILDEEVLIQGSSDSVALDRLCSYFENKGVVDKEELGPIRKCEQTLQFEIFHQLSKDPVRYDCTRWVNKAKVNLSAKNAIQVLQESKMGDIKNLFLTRSKIPLICRSVAGLEGNSQKALQRVGLVRKTFASSLAAVKRNSVCAQIILQADALMNLVKRSQVHFVHCFVPRSETDDTDCKVLTHSSKAEGEGGESSIMAVDIPTLRTQLFGAQLLDALRLCRIGYTDRMGFPEFRRRFQILSMPITKKFPPVYTTTDEKKATEELLQLLDLDKKSIVVGHSQIFMKYGVLSRLERQRQKLISQNIILFQASCKGFLCRQKCKKIKIQQIAIRCIQKNVVKFQAVKDWPWWQLMCCIRPSLSINVDERKLRAKEEELLALKIKLEKSERSHNELRQTTDLLESKITDLTTELSDERFKGEVACRVLKTEQADRLRTSREIKDLQNKYDQAQKNLESVAKQLEEAQQKIQQRELGSNSSGGNEWQIRFDCAQTEIEFLRKRVAQFEERLETEQKYRKELEDKLSEVQNAYEGVKRTAQQMKRKCKHLTSDLEDTRALMESQQSRNHDLEKKQRRFDMQLAQALGESAFEKSLREKVAQENTTCRWELGNLQHKLEQKELETVNLNKKTEVLAAQVKDLSTSNIFDANSLASLKKRVWELEASNAEQSHLLNERDNSIQQLEQIRLRFEMETERMKQIHLKDLEDKEEELEDIQQSCQRKLHQLQMQLEQEYEEKQMVLHEKQDLEGLIGTLCEQIGHRDFDVEKRLRRDLKRTHALLSDLQLLLATMENSGQSVSKGELEKVQSQLGESKAKYVEAEKSQKSLSLELENLHVDLENISRNKNMVDEQLYQLQYEKADLLKRIDEDQEDLNELMEKHKALIAQSALDITQIRELQEQVEVYKKEKQSLQEKLQVAQSRIDHLESTMVERSIVSRQEAAICDLENKVEFQKAQVKRYEMLILRLRDSVVKMGEELEKAADSEAREKENAKYYQMRVDEMKVEMQELSQREMEACRRRMELEKQADELSAVRQTLQADLETSIRRIADLQAALEEVESSDESDTESVQTSLESCSTRDIDSQSSIGSTLSLDLAGSVKSWLGSSAGWGTPSEAGTTRSFSRQSIADSITLHSQRINQDITKVQELRKPSSSVSTGREEYGRHVDKDNFKGQVRKPMESPVERASTSGIRKSPPSEETLPSSSSALSEFLEEVRRKRAIEKEQVTLSMEETSSLPIYQTTGASSLRRCRTFKDDDDDDFSRKLEIQEQSKNTGSSTSLGLMRSSSLRCIPSENLGATFSPAEKNIAKFGSCESLLQPQSTISHASLKISSPKPGLRPWRKCLEPSIEEASDSDLGKEPLVFQNKHFSTLVEDEDKRNSPARKVTSLNFERKTDDSFDEFLPAVRRARSATNLTKSDKEKSEGLRPLSVHSDDLPSEGNFQFSSGIKTTLKKTPSYREDLANLSDSSSSSGSILSYKSADSIKSRPRLQILEVEGSTAKSPAEDIRGAKRSEAEGNEADVNSIMMKYLRKTEEDQGSSK